MRPAISLQGIQKCPGVQGVHSRRGTLSSSMEQKRPGALGTVCHIVFQKHDHFLRTLPDRSLTTFLPEETCRTDGQKVTGPCAMCVHCELQMDPARGKLLLLILGTTPTVTRPGTGRDRIYSATRKESRHLEGLVVFPEGSPKGKLVSEPHPDAI